MAAAIMTMALEEHVAPPLSPPLALPGSAGLRQTAVGDNARRSSENCISDGSNSPASSRPMSASFEELLQKLGQAHDRDIKALEQDLEEAVTQWQKEVTSLRQNGDEDNSIVGLPNACPHDEHSSEKVTIDDGQTDPARKSTESTDVPDDTKRARFKTENRAGSSTQSLVKDRSASGKSLKSLKSTASTLTKAQKEMNFYSELKYEIMPCWQNAPSDLVRNGTEPNIGATELRMLQPMIQRRPSVSSGEDFIVQSSTFMRHFIAYPNTPVRMFWDLLGAVLIFYDLFNIPLSFFSRRQETFGMVVMDWFSMVFWTINVGMTLSVGYIDDGIMIMHPRSILLHYFKTWFAVDLIVVVPDWVFTIASLGSEKKSNAGSSLKMLRILRLVRMVRLLRLFKLRRIMQAVNDHIDSEYMSIFVNIAKMLVFLFTINHVIGCVWFGIGDSSIREGLHSWITLQDFDYDAFGEPVDWGYQYATSLHWSITQFTPASMHVQPQNIWERVYAIAIVFLGLVVFSYVVGSITSSLAQLRTMQEDAHKQFWLLRRYLKQHKVEKVLAHRLQKYLEHALQSRKERLRSTDIRIFSLLSEQLHSELVFKLAEPHLKVHPFFDQLSKTSRMTMHRLANNALAKKMVARTDELFIPGEKATHMLIVTLGRLHYHSAAASPDDDPEVVECAEDWIAEPVLWTHKWVHRGGLVAVTEAELTMIVPKVFEEVVHLSPPALALACTYARNYIRWVNEHVTVLSDISQGEDISDMCRGFLELEDVGEERKPSNMSLMWRAMRETTSNMDRSRSTRVRRDSAGSSGSQTNAGRSALETNAWARESRALPRNSFMKTVEHERPRTSVGSLS